MGKEGVTLSGFPPRLEELRELSRSREGEIKSLPFPLLLLSHYIEERTLVLELTKGRILKKISIDLGAPVDCQSNLAHETFGRYLASMGKFSEEDANRYFAESISRSVPFGELLVQNGILDHTELFKLLQQNLAKKLLDLFLWGEGNFKLSFDTGKNASSLKVNVPQLIFTGITKFASMEEVNRYLAPLIGKNLQRTMEPYFDEKELRLSQNASKVAAALEKPKRMDEVVGEVNLPFDDYSRIIYALSILGIVVPEEFNGGKAPKQAAPAQPPAAPPRPPAPAPQRPETPAAGPPVEAQKIKESLHKEYLSYRAKDPFELLGLTENSQMSQVREAFLDFASKYNPDRFEPSELSELREKAKELFLAGARAYGMLADQETRDRLKRERIEERQKKFSAPPQGQPNAYRELLDAKTQFKSAKALRQQGKHKEAMDYFDYAFELDPQNSEYGAELALQRYLHSTAFLQKALAELSEIIRRDPACFAAHINLSYLLAQSGKLEGSKRSWEAARKLSPSDPRVAEVREYLENKMKK